MTAQTTIGLAASLGMRTVAEGVETFEQLELLRDLGCDSVQGYLISRRAAARNCAKSTSLRAKLFAPTATVKARA